MLLLFITVIYCCETLFINLVIPDIEAELVEQVALELFQVPHIALNMMCDLLFLAVFGDTIITQVSVPVRNLVHIEVSCREADVGFSVNPNCQRIPIGD